MIKDLWLVLTGKLSSKRIELYETFLQYSRNELETYRQEHTEFQRQQRKLLEPICIALGRLVAKLDPTYVSDEIANPARRKQSDEIGAQAINKIIAEATARRKMEGRE